MLQPLKSGLEKPCLQFTVLKVQMFSVGTQRDTKVGADIPGVSELLDQN